MTIYEHKATLTVSGGSSNTLTLNVPGGLCNQFIVRANTDTTAFRADILDSDDDMRMAYGFHKGEIRDDTINLPVTGNINLRITNASVTDTFKVIFAVRER